MLEARWLHVIAAVLTATWAPGHLYCCCAARAAMAQTPDECAVEPAELSSCCAGEGVSAPAPASPMESGCGTGCGAPGSEEGCGCLHGPVDAAMPVAVALPGHGEHGLVDLDLLLELPAILGNLAPVHSGRCCRGSPHGPPPDTLLRQGCLLLV